MFGLKNKKGEFRICRFLFQCQEKIMQMDYQEIYFYILGFYEVKGNYVLKSYSILQFLCIDFREKHQFVAALIYTFIG